MKKAFCIIILLSFSRQVHGQTNLVSNPSFEIYTTCPNATDQLNFCLGWSSYSWSPDYFNACAIPGGVSVPSNGAGYQFASKGYAYAGLATFDNTFPNYREIIGSALTTTLQIGQKYFISFYVNMSGKSFVAGSDKMGVRFSTVPFSTTTPVPINNFSHYSSTTVITDTVNWIKLKGSFVADSVYKYIMIGNFYTDVNTSTVSIGSGNKAAYYYLDDICVSSDSSFASNWTGIKENQNRENYKIIPNPASEYFSILITNGSKINELNIVNNYGQIILAGMNFTNDKIDITNISDGLYFIQIISGGKTYYDKIIVQH